MGMFVSSPGAIAQARSPENPADLNDLPMVHVQQEIAAMSSAQ